MIVSAVISVHALGKEGEIKAASVLSRLTHSLDPQPSLNWLNGRSRKRGFTDFTGSFPSCFDVVVLPGRFYEGT